jgi:repressor LexA
MKALTDRQKELIDIIKEFLESQGMPPTIEEIRQAMGLRSPNGVRDHLRALERKGVLELVPGTSRGIRLLGPYLERVELDRSSYTLPIIGRVAAGNPILAEQHIEDHRQLDTALFPRQADYLLRVVGTSMKDIGIYEGDLLAVCKTDQVRDGQIVVARVDDEVTVKRFRQKGSTAFLQPENKDFQTIEVDLRRDAFEIEGVVIGVVREL